jgi:ribosomal protein S18 acetylase RimI-like enzyme
MFTFDLTPITPQNAAGLWEMLYQAIYVPPGSPPPPRKIVRQSALARYVGHWGRPGDLGLYAQAAPGQAIGAAWLRLWRPGERGYGWLDDTTPELSLAVLPPYRDQGVGTHLLAALLSQACGRYPNISLSVSRGNPAVHLYQRVGFVLAHEDDHSWTMRLTLPSANT